MRQLMLILFVCFLGNYAYAQSTELGLLGGFSVYSGDISEDEFGLYFENLKPAFGVFARFNLNRTFALRLGINHGQIQEEENELLNEEVPYFRNFKSNITEFALTAEVNLFRLGDSRGTQIAPYLFGGGAVFNIRPETLFDDNWVELQPLGTEGQGLPGYEEPYRLTQISVPVGIGLKLLMDGWTLALELGGRKTFTDYLDDVGHQTVMYRDILEGNGELAAIISNPTVDPSGEENPSYRRGGKFDDWYYIGGVTLSFELGGGGGGRRSGKNIGCPTF